MPGFHKEGSETSSTDLLSEEEKSDGSSIDDLSKYNSYSIYNSGSNITASETHSNSSWAFNILRRSTNSLINVFLR